MRSKKYLAFVRTLPCCHCENPETVPHHIIAVDSMGRMGGKASDLSVMPMCVKYHSELHRDTKDWPQTRYILETLEEAYQQGILKI
jgi:hypothetical protein